MIIWVKLIMPVLFSLHILVPTRLAPKKPVRINANKNKQVLHSTDSTTTH